MPSESMKKLLTLAMLGASMKKETPMPSDITAERLNEMVSQWPVGAKPERMYYSPSRSGEIDFFYLSDQQNYAGPCILPLAHAIAIHEAAGIRWLAKHIWTVGCSPVYVSEGEHDTRLGGWRIDFGYVGSDHEAPTLIEALHAAIMATAKEGA